MRSAQRQVELRRLGNQLPVFGKANSLCKIVNFCVFWPVFFFRVRAELKIGPIPGYRSSGKICVASRRCNTIPVVPPDGGRNTNYRFLRYFVCSESVPLFRSLMLTPMTARNSSQLEDGSPLGVVHNCHHFHERTQRTLFCDPLPPSQKRTFKMLIRNNPYQKGRVYVINRRLQTGFEIRQVIVVACRALYKV